LRGYLIRLTRGYTDGGMDSRAEVNYGMMHQLGVKILCFESRKDLKNYEANQTVKDGA
jgi:hypothetical protein